MALPNYSILYSAPTSGTGGAGSVADVLIKDATSGLYVKATTANRGSRRSTGIALHAYAAGSSVDIHQFGELDATTAGLGAGSASWVRVSTTGTLERASVSGSDDVVGYVEADGTFRACFGFLTAAIVNGGGGSFTAPTGTGFVSVTAGVLDAASIKVNLASTTYVTGTLPVANGGTGLTSLTIPASALLVGTTDAQTVTSKTMVLASNTVTDTSQALGDIAYCNGTRFARFARGTVAGQSLTATATTIAYSSNPGVAAQAIAALSIDWSAGTVFTKTLSAGGNTFTFANAASGMTIMVRLTGAASTVTWPTVKWAGGAAPTQTASGTDVYTFVHDGTSIYGSVVQAMA